MQITRITSYAIQVGIRKEVMLTTSLGTHDVSRYTLVRVETDAGIEGVGEATVAPRWSGETALGCKYLIDTYLGLELTGLDPEDIPAIEAALDRATQLNPFAKCAIEMACWDIRGKAAGKPVYELLGGACRDLAVPIRFSLAAISPEQTARNAVARVEWGHRTVKVKVGMNPDEDIDRIRTVREAIGPDVLLTVDANGGWNVPDSIRCLWAMEGCDLLLAEQPTPREDHEALRAVKRATRVPIMADESVFTLHDAQQVLNRQAADIISVYPGKNGGIRRTQQIAELAAPYGVACAIGSNLELDIATAAMLHLSAAVPNIHAERYHGDILGPLYHTTPVVRNPIRIEAGYAHCPTGPGLGVEVDWDVVRQLELRT